MAYNFFKILRTIGAIFLIIFGLTEGYFFGALAMDILIENVQVAAIKYIAVIIYAVIYIGIFLFFVWLAAKLEKKSLSDFGLVIEKGMFIRLGQGLLLGIGMFLLIAIPLYLTGEYKISIGTVGFSVVIMGFVEYIVVGFIEEVMCRGYLMHKLLSWGSMPALVMVSVIFSLLHLSNDNINILSFINICLAGTFLGAVLYSTHSLWAAVGVHITWNWIQGSVLGIPVSGAVTSGFFTTEIAGTNTIITGGAFGAEGSILCSVIMGAGTILLIRYARKKGKMKKYEDSNPL